MVKIRHQNIKFLDPFTLKYLLSAKSNQTKCISYKSVYTCFPTVTFLCKSQDFYLQSDL